MRMSICSFDFFLHLPFISSTTCSPILILARLGLQRLRASRRPAGAEQELPDDLVADPVHVWEQVPGLGVLVVPHPRQLPRHVPLDLHLHDPVLAPLPDAHDALAVGERVLDLRGVELPRAEQGRRVAAQRLVGPLLRRFGLEKRM